MNTRKDLNLQQRQSVESDSSVIVINAGPGTGKTKTLISRIAYLILEENVDPVSILAITFTKKAAAEMKSRLKSVFPDQPLPYIGTFHSLAFETLSAEKLIHIVTPKKQKEIVESINKTQEFAEIRTNTAFRTISLYKSRVNHYSDGRKSISQQEENFVLAYNKALKENNLCDFDDILLSFYEYLKDKEKSQTLHNQFQYILVDEFQDTNEVQYEIIKKLAENHSLFVIGDPFQSIYSFRGAGPDMFTRIITDFPQAKTITLPTNYRSAKYIVHVSSLLFPEGVSLVSYRQVNGTVEVINTYNEYSESEYILRTIGQFIGGTDLIQAGSVIDHTQPSTFADMAVIYRNHRISTIIQEKLFNSGIPYQVVGEDTPYEQIEIRFIIEILRSIYTKTYHLGAILEDYPFAKIHTDFPSYLKSYDISSKPSILIQKIVQDFRLSEQLESNKKHFFNLMQFQSTFSQFDNQKDALKRVIDYATFLQEHEYYDPTCEKVTLLSMHASKGLEFKHVFIPGFEETIIPNIKSDSDMEEEKRLLYVAMTRAKDSLHLIYTDTRNYKPTSVSRFKSIIQSDYLKELEDRATNSIKKKIEKAKIQKSQMKIF